MAPRFLTVSIFIFLECAGVSAGAESFYAWWRVDDAKRLDNGAVAQYLTLILSLGDVRTESAEYIVKQSALPAFDKKPVEERTAWKCGALFPDAAGTHHFAINAHRYCRTTVWAKVVAGGRTFWAQTIFNQYGKGDRPEDENAPPPQAPPVFALSSSGEDYWPQTGHVFTLAPQWDGAEALDSLTVTGESGDVLARLAIRDGTASYQPPPDPELDRAGDYAKKQLIFIAGNPQGGTNAFTLAVHRSRSGNMNLAAGLWYGGAMAAAALIAAVRLRRKGGR